MHVCTCCVLDFLLSSVDCALPVPMFPPPRKLHTYYRPERDIANKHTAHRRAISSAQATLGIISSPFAPTHGPVLSAPFTCFNCVLPFANIAGGVSHPRSGALLEHTVPPGAMRTTKYSGVQGTEIFLCTRLFSFLIDFVLPLLFAFLSSQTKPVLPIRR